MLSIRSNSFCSWLFSMLCLSGILITVCICPVVEAAVERESFNESDLAAHIIEMAGISRGVCSILGCDNEKLVLEIVRSSGFFVHMQDPDGDAVEKTKKLMDEENLYGKRVVVEKGSLDLLPYADNMVDLIIDTNLTGSELSKLSLSEIHRVLRPRGKAIFIRRNNREGSRDTLTLQQLKEWLQTSDVEEFRIDEDSFGLWVEVTKPSLTGVDNWSHWEHGPDNNPVSNDAVIKAPYMSQWFGYPIYSAMPAITTAAGGRTFLAMGHIAHHEREEKWLNTLYARNGYNGAKLWTRKLPDGYLVHRSAFIATDNTFYMIDTHGSGCLLLNPETGEEKDKISIPGVTGEWKWIALENGILFALVGKEKDPSQTTLVRSQYGAWSWDELSKGYYEKRIPWGFGTTILAYDTDKKRVVWIHKEEAPVDSRAMVMGDGKLFFYCPDAHIGSLDAKSGNLLWTNNDPNARELIEETGSGFRGTPGFRTTCISLYTPEALLFEADARLNVVAVSNKDGSLLWTRRKTTNDPNMLYVDNNIVVGIGPRGSHLVLNPLTGKTIEDLGFRKLNCTRLTATRDSYFCRGSYEGFMRYDRTAKKAFYDGSVRPACNDGVIGANGMLYMGPWLCDCNLTLIGSVAMCSAGDFTFGYEATEQECLETVETGISGGARLEVSDMDWSTYRANNNRSASSKAAVSEEAEKLWEFSAKNSYKPTAPTASGGLIFLGGDDCRVRAIDAKTGNLKWCYLTAGSITQPPTIWNGRVYVGSGDGYVYCLNAATGTLVWRFRAAPIERHIMVYGSLCSTWPVNSGVLVEDGVAYFAAGIIDYDGTYVYALDAETGKIKWQNNTSGHLDKELRKGVSAQGILTIADGRLFMAGGNLVSPAVYDIETGKYLGNSPGNRRTNRGEEIGIFNKSYVILGGRLKFSATKNVVNPGIFQAIQLIPGGETGGSKLLTKGKIPPAWDDRKIVFVDGWNTMPKCFATAQIDEYLTEETREIELPEYIWEASEPSGPEQRKYRLNHSGHQTPTERDTVSLAIARNAVLAVYETKGYSMLQSRWSVCALSPRDGSVIWEHILSPWGIRGERDNNVDTPERPALPGGLLVDRDGRVVVVLENGNVLCFGD